MSVIYVSCIEVSLGEFKTTSARLVCLKFDQVCGLAQSCGWLNYVERLRYGKRKFFLQNHCTVYSMIKFGHLTPEDYANFNFDRFVPDDETRAAVSIPESCWYCFVKFYYFLWKPESWTTWKQIVQLLVS